VNMQYRIQARNLSVSRSLFEHVRRRFGSALDRLSSRIAHAQVRFEDENGPRGGRDKSCTLVLRLVGGGVVQLRERSDCPFGAVDRLSTRAKAAVTRRIEKLRDRRRERRKSRDPGSASA
jgi:putative sigma-54 modulation protein